MLGTAVLADLQLACESQALEVDLLLELIRSPVEL